MRISQSTYSNVCLHSVNVILVSEFNHFNYFTTDKDQKVIFKYDTYFWLIRVARLDSKKVYMDFEKFLEVHKSILPQDITFYDRALIGSSIFLVQCMNNI